MSALDLESRGYATRYLIEPPHVRELTAAAYSERLVHTFGPFTSDVRAVLAYCTASSIAQELVASLAANDGITVPLIVFDGEPATPEAIRQQYVTGIRKLGALLGVERDRVVIPDAFDDRLLREHPDEAVRRMREGLLHLAPLAAEGRPDEAEEVLAETEAAVEFYLDWLFHLVAALNTSWPTWAGPAFQIVSRDHERYAPEWPGAAATRTVRVDAGRIGLLRHPDTASAVVSILEGHGAR